MVGGFGTGPPVAAIVLEDLVALGTTEFISIGTAGGLQRDLDIGDIVVCSEAIRDEGASHHYLAPAERAQPSAALSERLRAALSKSGFQFTEGPSWTIDTPYWETVDEAWRYHREGVRTVEMEAAAVIAAAEHQQVAAAPAFVGSDSVAELVWDPWFAAASVGSSLERLFRAAVAARDDDKFGAPGHAG